jgi:hypothetical protein
MTKSEKFFKWVDTNFGVGGTTNYNPEQLNDLRKFIKSVCSPDFGFAERDTLPKILEKLISLDADARDEIYDMLEGF